eukprot:TRINITY_DN1756_c0_g5_i1.p1 TRINITY_DN1756_c0_g5~~TRINITY_DN1756_c0_g5_i1.p1  ORF type:complete len:424 (-),score=10.50 TRINITY_DN1756_c0_g5_i1:1125-2210(-)
MKMSAGNPLKRKSCKVESAKQFFWYEVSGIDKDYIMLEGDMLIKDIKSAIYEKLPELLKTKYGASNKNSLILIHNNKVLTDDTIVPMDASTIYSPTIVSWPGSENLMRLIKALERLEKPLLPPPPLHIQHLYHSPILTDKLLGMVDKEKYIPYLSAAEITKIAEILKAKMLKEPLVIDTKAGVTTAVYTFLKYALLKTSHLSHIKISYEYVIEQEFYDKKKICYKADLAVYDVIEGIIIFITGVKLTEFQNILDAIKQNVEQLRLYAVSQNVKKVYGIATTYSDWVIIHYECKPDGEETVEMTKLISIGLYQNEIVANVEQVIKLLRATLWLAYEAKSVNFTQLLNHSCISLLCLFQIHYT